MSYTSDLFFTTLKYNELSLFLSMREADVVIVIGAVAIYAMRLSYVVVVFALAVAWVMIDDSGKCFN